MDLATALAELGHVATRRRLLTVATRREIDTAVRQGRIERLSRGRYVSVGMDAQRRHALALHGVLSHESAALLHGIKVKHQPDRPWITVPRNRSRARHDGCCEVRFRRLAPEEHRGGVTRPLRTVLDCARDLPFDRALTVADGAVRTGLVTRDQLIDAAAALRGPGSARARLVAHHCTDHSSGPMESVLRAIAIEEGLDLTPQLQVWDVGLWATVDLGSEELRLVLEADSFAWHGDRRALDRDCRRYDELAVWGWTVLRFSWEQIMLEPDFVRWALRHVLRGREGAKPPPAPAPRRR